jgi:hypothetical protein
MRTKATWSQIHNEVNYYMTSLEPRRLKTNAPAWWPQRLSFLGLRELGKHGKPGNFTLCLVAYN